MMTRPCTLALIAVVATACSKPTSTTIATADSTAAATPLGDTAVAPAPAPAPPPAAPETVYVEQRHRPRREPPRREPPPRAEPARPAPVEAQPAPPSSAGATLAAGSMINTVALDSISSRSTQVGDVIRTRVAEDVVADGRVVIPAGAVVRLTVTAIESAHGSGKKGTLELEARDVEINGSRHHLVARATDYTYEMKGRGIGGQEVATTGIGAAIGGVVGHIIGGGTGTVVGAVGGAAGGAALAAKNAEHDIVVHTGAAIRLTVEEYD